VQTQADSDHLNRSLTKSFIAREFICPCCYEEGIKNELVFYLQFAHDLLPPNSVIVIKSGYRCEKENKKAGGVENSAHMKGLAADIRCDHSSYRFSLIRALSGAGFKRIGIGENFIHCDRDLEKPQNVMWTYY